MTWCVICKMTPGHSRAKKEKLTFHTFPKYEPWRTLWCNFSRIQASEIKKRYSGLCSRHFCDKYFVQQSFMVVLKRNAVPTLAGPVAPQGCWAPTGPTDAQKTSSVGGNSLASRGHTSSPLSATASDFRMTKCFICHLGKSHFDAKIEKLSFHKFPTKAERRRAWADFCRIHESDVTEKHFLCSRHFKEDDFKANDVMASLKKNSVPLFGRPPPPVYELPIANEVDGLESILSGRVQPIEAQDADDATSSNVLSEDEGLDGLEELNVPSEFAALLCRMCGRQEDNMLSVHSPGLPDDELSIAVKMRMHLSVEVSSEDSLPQSICLRCCEALNSWHETFVSSLAADKVLRKCFMVEDDAAKSEAMDSQQVPSEPTDSSTSRYETTEEWFKEVQPAVAGQKDAATSTEPDEEDKASDFKLLVNPLSPKTSQYPCVYCSVIFRDMEELQVHRVQCSLSRFLCEKCGKDFPSRKYSKSHLRLHADIESGNFFACKQCGKVFWTKEKRQGHVCRPHGKVCKICSQVFDTRDRLLSHQLTHSHLNFFCEPCCRIFLNGNALKRHQLEHKPVQANPLIDKVCHTSCSGGQTTYSCKVCGVAFESKLLLISHLNSPAPSTCPQCGKELRTEKQRFVHTTTCRSLECRFCAKMLKSRVMLRDHENRHMDNRSHKCQFCDRSFCTLAQKRNHERKHVGPTFSCKICGRRFFFNFKLKYHLLKHAGVKFPCDVCQKDFASKMNVYKHKRKFHRDTLR